MVTARSLAPLLTSMSFLEARILLFYAFVCMSHPEVAQVILYAGGNTSVCNLRRR